MKEESKFACLTYHIIAEGKSQYTVSEQQLRHHLALLKAEAYVVDGFEQLEARLRSGMGVPPRYIVFTIDDGHESSMRAADLLQEYGFKATFFLTRDRSVSGPGFIRENGIRELRRRGFSVGTHGTTHHALTFLPQEHCIAKLKDSKQWLEDVIGEGVRYIAAPGGFINSRIIKLTHEQGYVLTGTCHEWMNSPETMILPCKVNRVNVRRHFSIKAFRHIIEGHLGFYMWRQIRATALAVPKRLDCSWSHAPDIHHFQ
jgi:peptidoglycan/xylan/chitin deacetylase (PgdA/CDA1 family)